MATNTKTKALSRPAKGEFNDMSHLFLKRFADDDTSLCASAKRRVKHDATVDYTPRAGSTCKVCRTKIDRGMLRVGLLLQCHRGYKTAAYVHGDSCLWQHREVGKILGIGEFLGHEKLEPAHLALFEKNLAGGGEKRKEASKEEKDAVAEAAEAKKRRKVGN